jgi:hypothetical protein
MKTSLNDNIQIKKIKKKNKKQKSTWLTLKTGDSSHEPKANPIEGKIK